MSDSTTVSRWPAMALAVMCTGVTGWLLMAEVVRGDVPLQVTHVLNGAAIVLLIAAGHYTLKFWAGGRYVVAPLTALGGVAAAVLVVGIGLARIAEGHAVRASIAQDRADQRKDLRDARDELARIGTGRTAGEIAADLAPVLATVGRTNCLDWTPNAAVRAACKRKGELDAELARAQRRETLETIVRQGAGAAIHTDGTRATARMLARWTGWTEAHLADIIGDVMTVTPVLTVELFTALFWVVALSPSRRSRHRDQSPVGLVPQVPPASRASNDGPVGPTGPEPASSASRQWSKAEAHADWRDLMARGETITQRDLAERWSRPKQTVSTWLTEWGATRKRVGRQTAVGRAGPARHAVN